MSIEQKTIPRETAEETINELFSFIEVFLKTRGLGSSYGIYISQVAKIQGEEGELGGHLVGNAILTGEEGISGEIASHLMLSSYRRSKSWFQGAIEEMRRETGVRIPFDEAIGVIENRFGNGTVIRREVRTNKNQ